MKTLNTRAALFLGAIFFMAAPASANSGLTVTGKIRMINVQADGEFWIRLDGNPQLCVDDQSSTDHTSVAKAGRSTSNGTTTNDGVANMLKTAMAAYLADKPVTVKSDPSVNEWGCRMANLTFE